MAREAIAAAERDEDYLRHAVDELAALRPQEARKRRWRRNVTACSSRNAGPRRSTPR